MTVETDDALSDVLQLVRLSGCVYFMSDFHAPWGMAMPESGVAQFHLVVRGQCWLRLDGERRLLSAGDVVVFPFGDAHDLSAEPAGATRPGPDVLAEIQAGATPFPAGGNGAADTRLLCGHFEFDRAQRHPLLQAMPRLIHVAGMADMQAGWIELVAPMLVRETGSGRPGAETVIERLAEVLLIQVLRAHLLGQEAGQGFLSALADRQISRALKLIHRRAGDDLRLEDIARAVGMSRSNLALRFKQLMGMGPMAYLTRWRLLQARAMLQTTGASLDEIAEAVGYASAAAFSRAFKREFDENPGEVRVSSR